MRGIPRINGPGDVRRAEAAFIRGNRDAGDGVAESGASNRMQAFKFAEGGGGRDSEGAGEGEGGFDFGGAAEIAEEIAGW